MSRKRRAQAAAQDRPNEGIASHARKRPRTRAVEASYALSSLQPRKNGDGQAAASSAHAHSSQRESDADSEALTAPISRSSSSPLERATNTTDDDSSLVDSSASTTQVVDTPSKAEASDTSDGVDSDDAHDAAGGTVEVSNLKANRVHR